MNINSTLSESTFRTENSQLRNKIKMLELEICERTRNYLLQRNKNKSVASCHPTLSKEVQTEFIANQRISHQQSAFKTAQRPQQIYESRPTDPNVYMFSSSEQKQSTFRDDLDERSPSSLKKPKDFIHFQLEEFDSSPKTQTVNKSLDFEKANSHEKKVLLALNKLEEQRKIDFDNQSTSSVSEQTKNSETDRELRKLKKKMVKLTKQIEEEIACSNYLKEALMASEEENYKFRLKIENITSQLDRSVSASNESKEELYRLENTKDEYFAELVKGREDNCNLRQELKKLKQYTLILEGNIHTTSTSQLLSGATHDYLLQILKEKIFSISNCIPITDTHVQMNIFRPESDQEIIQMLVRIEEFTKHLPIWEKKREKLLQIEKQVIKQFIAKIAGLQVPINRQNLLQIMRSDDKLQIYADLLSKKVQPSAKNHPQLATENKTTRRRQSPPNDPRSYPYQQYKVLVLQSSKIKSSD